MMRFLVFIIACSFLVKPVLPLFDYIFNYEYIVTELCENRDKPRLNCNGTCYLMKSLAQEAQQNEKDKKENLASRYSLDLLFIEVQQEVAASLLPQLHKEAVLDRYQTRYKYLHYRRDLRPPAA